MPGRLRRIIRRARANDRFRAVWDLALLARWKAGKNLATPPPAAKRRIVRAYTTLLPHRTLIETGTLFGDMIAANKNRFSSIISLELDPGLAQRAQRRFVHLSHVEVLVGDSGDLLPGVLADVEEPCLFWLDAHAMAGGIRGKNVTPIDRELTAILESSLADYTVLIDDARLFTETSAYPCLKEVRTRCRTRHPDWVFEVRDDVIRFHPPR